jgi:mannosyltransferase
VQFSSTSSESRQSDLTAQPTQKRIRILISAGVSILSLLGAGFRFYGLGLNPMYDEAASWTFATLPWHMFWQSIWNSEGNMVLYYLVLRFWVHLGDREVVLRSLSVMFGIATIPIVYALGVRLIGRRAGMLAAAFITVHAFHIRWSQEARSYAMLVFLISLSTLLLISAVKRPRARGIWASYILVSVLACYCHMLALLVVAAQWLWIVKNNPSLVRSRIVFLGAQLALVAPLILYAVFRDQGQLAWVPALNLRLLWDVVRSLAGIERTGPLGSSIMLLLYAGMLLLALRLAFRFQGGPTNSGITLLPLWLFFPLSVLTLISMIKPILVNRFLLMLLPAWVLLVAFALDSLLRGEKIGKWTGSASAAAILSLSAYCSAMQYRAATQEPNDFKEMTNYVLSAQQDGDGTVFFTAATYMSFRYYTSFPGEVQTPKAAFPDFGDLQTGSQPIPSRELIERRTAPFSRIWLVLDERTIALRPVWRETLPQLYKALEHNFKLQGEHPAGRFLIKLYTRK